MGDSGIMSIGYCIKVIARTKNWLSLLLFGNQRNERSLKRAELEQTLRAKQQISGPNHPGAKQQK